MSSFTNSLKIEILEKSDNIVLFGSPDDNFRLLEDISFYSLKVDRGLKTTLKAGFISDGDSTPFYLKPIVRASGLCYQKAYALHDAWFRVFYYYFIMNNGKTPLPMEHAECPESYKEGNLLLDEALEVLGLGAYARSKVYYGLQVGGRSTKNEAMIENALEYTEFEYVEIIDDKEKSEV